MTTQCEVLSTHLQTELGKSLFGMQDVIHGMCIALIGGGHVLLEGSPGLGKTRLSKGFAELLGGTFKRIQGTADLMPADLTGVHVFNSETRKFEFQPGPLFADVVLVDEINRASPKTQSALLEAMEERQVSVDRDSFPLSADFLVVATQNPHEFEGTFPLPESQLDRFLLKLSVGYLTRETEAHVLAMYSGPGGLAEIEAIRPLPDTLLSEARSEITAIHLSPELIGYALDIANASRESSSIELGLSIRGALALTRAARIEAALRGGEFVVPDDVLRVAPWVIPHRISLTAEAQIEGRVAVDEVERITQHLDVPK